MSIVLAFTSGHSPYDEVIKAIEHGLWHHIGAPLPLASHCFAERHFPTGAVRAVEAATGGVRAFDPSEKAGQVVRRYRLDCTPEQERKVWATLMFHVNAHTPYGWGSAVKAGWYVLTGRRRDAFNRDPHARIFCSMLLIDALRAADIPVEMVPQAGEEAMTLTFVGVPSDNSTPARLEVFCVRAGYPLVSERQG